MGKPLVKFSSINDSIFNDFKGIIGEFHFTPTEAYECFYENESFEEGSVILCEHNNPVRQKKY